jgi:hypothetical protein
MATTVNHNSVIQPAVTVTRSSKIRLHTKRGVALVMVVPRDIVELAGYRDGDAVLVSGCEDGTMKVVKADKVGIGEVTGTNGGGR